MSLRARLALFGAGVVAFALVVFGLLLFALLSRGAVTNQDDAIRSRAHDAAASLAGSPPRQAPLAPSDLGNSADVFVELMSPDGSVVYSTGVLHGSPPVATQSLLDQARLHHGAFATQGSLRLYALPYSGGYVVTGQSTKVVQSNVSGIVVFLVISAIPALVAALLASWLVAGRALAPLKSVAVAAEEIGRTRDFGRRLPPRHSRDEVAALTAGFNGMLSRLQDAFESQRRFVADASHELRTPLTTIQGNAGLLARGPEVTEEVRTAAAADIAEESARMARLVDRMLTLARADSGLELGATEVQLDALVEEVGRQAARSHSERALDNAFRYARSSVDVRLFTEPGWARLVVVDDGPGVMVEHRERIFERFYRAEGARTGSHAGLGLSIAQWIVAQHRGRITVGDANGGGAAFLVDLPLLRAS